MHIVLSIFATLAGLLGVFYLSQATVGVGVIALGCLLGILARIIQAAEHHKSTASIKAPG